MTGLKTQVRSSACDNQLMEFFEWLPLALALLNLVSILWLGLRANPSQQRASDDLKSSFQAANERTERELRDELGRSAQGTRLELGAALSTGLSSRACFKKARSNNKPLSRKRRTNR
jgi:hypothetical protein